MKEIIKMVESGVVVFKRTKAFVASSGSVWASRIEEDKTVCYFIVFSREE